MRSALYAYLNAAVRRVRNELVPFKPNARHVSHVLDALAGETQLSNLQRAPVWLDGAVDHLPAAEMVACTNGLLHLPTGKLLPATPLLFALNAVDFPFEPAAPEPRQWLEFLEALWGKDAQSIAALQAWFGYCLTADTSQQKILLIVGPKRSGKGTILRVLIALLGGGNACAATLAGLGTDFGLAPLIGKQLAIISDARLGGRIDLHAIAERLLSVSGEDLQTINRKHREHWTGHLGTRFMITTNELPRLADASGALASRFIVLRLKESFYGREDHKLAGRLLQELPGILNWAMEGWRALQKRGHFVQPASAAEAIRDLEDLASPIGAFIRDECMVGANLTVARNKLYEHWCAWCSAQGRDYPGTIATFGRDLRAAVPGLEDVRPRDEDGNRERLYRGVGLKPEKQKATEDVFPGFST
jgi:putative DNA primase/helicase